MSSNSSRKLEFKQVLVIVLFVTLYIVAIWYAANYFKARYSKSDSGLSSHPDFEELKDRNPKEKEAITSLDKASWEGSWEKLAQEKNRISKDFSKNQFKPSLGASVYFFQEHLESGSLEKQFTDGHLEPGLKNLRQAYEYGNDKDAKRAYETLQNRVENYELGATTQASELSEDAQKFLEIYQRFSSHKK
ncbi:hypothetical protein K2X30_10070 [bacterium]|nr:hypothetical protein [bacterium]